MTLLPKLQTATHDLTTPVSGRSVKFRKMLVKDNKAIIAAVESKDAQKLFKTMKKVLSDCLADEKSSLSDWYQLDVDALFVAVRRESEESGTIEIDVVDDETGQKVKATVDLAKVRCENADGWNRTKPVTIPSTENVQIILDLPKLGQIEAYGLGKRTQSEVSFDLVLDCVESIVWGTTVYKKLDVPKKEINEFLESLDAIQYTAIADYFQNSPKLVADAVYTVDGVEKTKKLVGVQQIFGMTEKPDDSPK